MPDVPVVFALRMMYTSRDMKIFLMSMTESMRDVCILCLLSTVLRMGAEERSSISNIGLGVLQGFIYHNTDLSLLGQDT